MSGGAVSVLDLAKYPTPELLASGIQESLQSNGFLFISNHGLNSDEMFSISEDFFANETTEEKPRCAYKDNQGYTKVSQEQLDPNEDAPDLKEGFNLGYVAPTSPPTPTQALPALLQANIDKLTKFQHDCFNFCQRLLEAIAISLELEPNFFKKSHIHDSTTRSILRFLHYPAVPPGVNVSPNRAGAHSDYGSLTLLFQRSTGGEGLQILPSTEKLGSTNWKDTGIVDGALLVNIGDALELWSGARFKSTLHRVVLPTPVPAEGYPERYSIAWFNQPTPSASLLTVVPVSDITENDFARMERKGAKPGVDISAGEHLLARLAATYRQVPAS